MSDHESGARQAILAAVRRNQPAEQSRAEGQPNWICYDDPVEQFCTTLSAVGGVAKRVHDIQELDQLLQAMPVYGMSNRICSLVPGAGVSSFEMEDVDDPHCLEDVDLAIVPAHFGVAENAAVWLTDHSFRHRVLPFICQHLAVVLSANEIVNNMHDAYRRMADHEALWSGCFGTFLSGPSKTADIEQSLVIGAHGPRSLTVFLT